MPSLADLRIKIFADGADTPSIKELRRNPLVKGFTTNPSLMRAAGWIRYDAFAREALEAADGLPISFEVIADTFDEMERQARVIASWGENVYVKIPITNTKGEPSFPLIAALSREDIKINVTAVMTSHQAQWAIRALDEGLKEAIISVFAGRISDAGYRASDVVQDCVDIASGYPGVEILWASTREVFSIFQAEAAGADIITVTPDLLKKLPLIGKDLTEYSLETVKQFYADGQAAGYAL